MNAILVNKKGLTVPRCDAWDGFSVYVDEFAAVHDAKTGVCTHLVTFLMLFSMKNVVIVVFWG